MSKQSMFSDTVRLPDPHLTQAKLDRLVRLVRITMNVPVASLLMGTQIMTLFESQSCASSTLDPLASIFSHASLRDQLYEKMIMSSHPVLHSEERLSFIIAPLITDSGMILGTLAVCAEDRTWNNEEIALLRDMAASATSECALYLLKIEQAMITAQGIGVPYIATPDDELFYVSSQSEALFGLSPTEWLKPSFETPYAQTQVTDSFYAYPNGTTRHKSDLIKSANGSATSVKDEKQLIYTQEGQPHFVLGMLRPVEKKQEVSSFLLPSIASTVDLPECEDRYQKLVEYFPETIIVHSQGEIKYINPAGVALLGATTKEELLNQPFLNFVHPDFRALHTNPSLKSQTVESTSKHFIQHKLLRLDDESVEVLMRDMPITFDGQPATQAIMIDITERIKNETALLHSENRFRVMIENSSDAIVLISRTGTILYVGPSTNRILRYNEGEMIGRNPIEFIHPKDVQRIMLRLMQLAQTPGSIMKDEYRLRSKDGSWRWVEGVAKNGLNEPGLEAIILNHHDITERKEAEEALRVSQERYALAANGANDGLWDWNLETNELYLSSRWKTMLGYDKREIGQHPDEWFKLVHPEDLITLKAQLDDHVQDKTSHFENEHRIRHKNGSYCWMLSRGLAVRDQKGKAYRIAGSQTDITERKHHEEKLLYQAFHDPLTGLPNRALFMKRLEEAIADAHDTQPVDEPTFAVLYLDFDRFKLVNDSYGHLAGDELLIKIGKRLDKYVGSYGIVARLGGDEFTILLKNIQDIHDAIALAEQIQQALTLPFKLKDQEIFISASIGIVLGDGHYEQPEYVLRDADIAMYQAKALGKARHEVFDEHMHLAAMALLQLENDLRRAIDREEFLLYYQPLVSMESGQPVGFEALVRWQHPTRGMVSPGEFIPAAEETGLIVPLGEWVLRTACEQMSQWQPFFPTNPPLTISVNLSSKQLTKPDLVFKVERILKESGLQANSLKLEITESVMIEQTDAANETLESLRDLGIELQLDDFGTGYSSLGYLQKLPVAAIKIDRSFIRYIAGSAEHIEIVRTIVMLARNLSMKVVAEGIETKEQEELLRSLGCDYGQGYLFAAPLPSLAAEKLLAQSQW